MLIEEVAVPEKVPVFLFPDDILPQANFKTIKPPIARSITTSRRKGE
jgi:hypothetical protein